MFAGVTLSASADTLSIDGSGFQDATITKGTIYYWHKRMPPAEVRCEVLQDPLRVVIQFLDGGRPFDPLARDDADISAAALFSREGGLGILLVKETMDEVKYTYEEGKNIVTILKKL